MLARNVSTLAARQIRRIFGLALVGVLLMAGLIVPTLPASMQAQAGAAVRSAANVFGGCAFRQATGIAADRKSVV